MPARADVLYRLDCVGVTLGSREVLRGATLQHNEGEKLILLGRNGSGKTTLLRAINGELEPESGIIERARDLSLAYLEQSLTDDPRTPVLEHCLGAFTGLLAAELELAELEGLAHDPSAGAVARIHHLHELIERADGFRARPRAQAALQGLGIPQELHVRPLGSLSGGERTRVALVRALLAPARLLLLDEPTNHLDMLGVEYLAEELAARDGALLLVTHDRELVDRVGGEILELHGGRVERYPAGYERYRREREQRRAHSRRAWELQRAEIERQEEFIRRNIAGQNTRQAQARIKLLEKLPRLAPPEPDLPPLRMRWPAAARSGERVLEAADLSAGFAAPVLREVSLTLRRGERLVIVGRNGAGKTTMLLTLAGRLAPLGGRLRIGVGVVPGCYDQDHTDLPEAGSVLGALLEARPDWTPAEARAWAGRFGFSGEAAEAATMTLSGGERSRLALARLLAIGPNLMLLDEPTNHLDLPTCEVLEDALLQFPGALVLVTHDRRLADRVATHVLVLDGGKATQVNWVSDAYALLGLRAVASPRVAAVVPSARRSALEEERRRLRRDAARSRERAELLAAELEQAETRLREIDEMLCQREVFSD
ncbi:MAG: ABC-F family ATP-binding cassette domain-containing protein, partial [Acidobacteriota bacterium]